MPHVSERQPSDDDLKRRDTTDAPDHKPTGELGGHPVNADETAPREAMPDPHGSDRGPDRHPAAVDDQPGSDL